MAVKGLTTPLSRWLQGSWLFVQVLGDLRVVSYWIDTLVLKNWGKYLRYFAASPFPLQGKTNACSRRSKKDFWRRCRGVYAQVKTYQVPITNSYPSHYIIFHLPLVFLSPTSPLPFLRLLPVCIFVCLCVGLLAAMAQDNTKLCDFSNNITTTNSKLFSM